jgi:cysteinyl-tRNA synthetase
MIRLFNTLSQRVEPLEPVGNRVSLYVCGVTPYDTTHLGHAFAYVAFDVLVRLLKYEGVEVLYAQNVTDIDDDILRKANEVGLAYDELARRETKRFRHDMDALNVLRPDHFVRATEMVPEIVAAIQQLLESGRAYVSDGNVYFDNRAFPNYGAICHCPRDEMIRLAAEHGGFPDDPRKRDPLDFLLWQKHLRGEPEWPSPFGPGRPGWHIECSTIATSVLGVPVDIHGGGSDLVFPHHASEIAQAESITGTHPYVRHWMHNAMVSMDGEKMSKSLGNMVFVHDLLDRYSSDAIRLYLLAHHYRQPFEYDQSELDRMAGVAERLTALAIERTPDSLEVRRTSPPRFRQALANDLATPEVVAELTKVAEGTGSLRGDDAELLRCAREVLGLRLA